MAVKNDVSEASFRALIQQAIAAYERAAATSAKARRKAGRDHSQRLANLAAQEKAEAGQQEQMASGQQAVGSAEAERAEVIGSLADDLMESATRLLEHAALAYVRGFGPGSAGTLQPHTASDERVAAAFTTAQAASADLRSALLKLAEAHLDSRDWAQARKILNQLRSGPPGALAEEATDLLREVNLREIRQAIEGADPGQAVAQASAWLEAHQDDSDCRLLLLQATRKWREICILRAQEALAGGEPEKALKTAITWLGDHKEDSGFQDLLLQATFDLADAALAADDPDGALTSVALAGQRVGRDHPRLRQWKRRRPPLVWRTGEAVLLREFGGHSRPVLDVAFSADGRHVVSIDGAEAKTWDVKALPRGALETTVSLPEAIALHPGGLLALDDNGLLRDTREGKQVRAIEIGSSGRIAAYAFSGDGSMIAWAKRDRNWHLNVSFNRGQYTARNPGRSELTDQQAQMIWQEYSRYMRFNAPKLSGGSSSTSTFISGGVQNVSFNFIGSLHINESETGGLVCAVNMSLSHIFLDIALSKEKGLVATLDPAGDVVVTDITTAVTRHSLSFGQVPEPISAVDFSPDGELLVAAASYQDTSTAEQVTSAACWEMSSGSFAWSWKTTGEAHSFRFSPDGRLLAAIMRDGAIGFFDVRARKELPRIGGQAKLDFPCLAFSPDGCLLATGGDRMVRIWGLSPG
jgi:WD40 repeat protein